MHRLLGRVAAITGAASGIGRATAHELAMRGCHLALADVDEAGLESTAERLRRRGGPVTTHVVDVRDAERVQGFADEVESAHGRCEILINNAGVTSAGRFEDDTDADLAWIVDINLWGVVHGCRSFLPLLRRADEGHIVNLSSMVGLLGLPQNASYSLTKGAVRSFSEALRAELRSAHIGVTSVHPGAINTNIARSARGSEGHRIAALAESRLAPIVMRPPEVVAGRIVRAIDLDRARAVVGPDAHLLDIASRVLPGRSGLIGRLVDRLG